jgi:2-desacetyl-2-hydroxyethyl bacteriochlorophyllide A dehydrogenase
VSAPTARALFFTAPGRVAVREVPLPPPGPEAVLVRTLVSAISAGTELLVYRGQAPTDLPVDETIAALPGRFAYPLRYGYAAVGEVVGLGPGVADDWLGRRVFAFQPHQSHFVAPLAALHPVPADLPTATAALLPSMETAVNLVLDGQPLVGEHVAVFGQGVVGLLTTAALARFPLAALVALDPAPLRREWAARLGASDSLDPADPAALRAALADDQGRPIGADLTFELSGQPAALDQAIAATGYHGRVVIGSWYGRKPVSLDLGGAFHRSKIRLMASQVSRLAPPLTGRWSTERRLAVAWALLRELPLAAIISHQFPLEGAATAYELLDQRPGTTLQILLTHESAPVGGGE